MTIGFDLTQFGVQPNKPVNRPVQPVASPTPQPQPTQIIDDPSMPQTVNEALTKPLDVQVHSEDGSDFEDKLGKNAPGLKKALWGVDKFAANVRPVQVTGKDGRKIWVDANGNNILDPDTGQILTKPLPSTADDKKEINFHGDSEGDTLELSK